MNNKLIRAIMLVTAFIGGLLLYFNFAKQDNGPDAAMLRITVLNAPRPLPEFVLFDQFGQHFDPPSFAGHWSVVFFGFTSCPDICPTTLLDLSRFSKNLTDLPAAQQPHIYMASVDPQRDTPERLAQYLQSFDPAFTGITGEDEQIALLAASLGVGYGRQDLDDGDYTMMHSAALFILNPDGHYVGVSSPPHDMAVLAKDFRSLLIRPTG